MLNSYIKTARRSLWRHRFYTVLNVLGLSLGIAGGLLLFQFIRFHLSFDRYHQKEDGLYRVVTELHLDDGSVEHEQGAPLELTTALQNEVPQVKEQAVITKLRNATVGVGTRTGQPKFFTEQDNIAFADQRWFNLFDYTWLAGNAATSLRDPNTAVITRQLANKYFGTAEPIGKTIRLDDKFPLKITGILEDHPGNTDLKVDMFISRISFPAFYPPIAAFMQFWGTINNTTQSYIWLPDGTARQKAEATMDRLKRQHFDKSVVSVYQFHLQPLKDIHFDARYGGSMQRSLLTTLAIVGLFLVLIACFNFINLATAQSVRRSREVGTRKVLGSTAAAIFWQFMTETAVMVLLATALSLVWIQLSLPLSYRWLQTRLSFDLFHDRELLGFLLLLISLVTGMAGFYPALVLSRWRPVSALKSQVSDTRSVLFRKGLIILQHVVVQALIICTIVITLQIKYMKNADPGFNKEAVLMIPIPDPDKSKLSWLENQLLADPGIRSVSFCYQAPLSEANLGGSISYDSRPWENFMGRTILADAGYLNTFQLQLLAGRNIQPGDTVRETLLNETLLHKFGFKDPQQVIGHRLIAGGLGDHPATIVGVVKDFNLHPLYAGMDPVFITSQRSRYRFAAIKLSGGHQGPTREAIQKIWQSVYPDNVFDYHYLNEEIDAFYHKEDLLNKLINTTALIAIIISCLGLSGLISFFAVQRTKEIGIRKVLGATVPGIVYLLSRDFLKMTAWATVIAAPIAWYFMNTWLRNFAYRIPISWWIFVLAGLLSVLIALGTVSYQAIKAALANPADSLHNE